MPNHRNRYPARRRFLKQSSALTAAAVALPLPRVTKANSPPGDRAQPAAGKRSRTPR